MNSILYDGLGKSTAPGSEFKSIQYSPSVYMCVFVCLCVSLEVS